MAKSFNADQKAKDRESAEITIGGEVYHPAPTKVTVMREFRRVARDDGRFQRDQDRLEKQQEANPDVDVDDQLEDIARKRERLTYEMLVALMVPSNGHPMIDTDGLMDVLPIQEAGELLEFLTPGAGEPDPTSPTEPTST